MRSAGLTRGLSAHGSREAFGVRASSAPLSVLVIGAGLFGCGRL
jgi:hypothetical protein